MERTFRSFCIAGTHSGVGKTTITLGLLAALRGRGLKVQPFKCGPDYIDAGHHTMAAGRTSRNLDTWMMGEEAVRSSFARASHNADAAVVEGVMGLFDGASSQSEEGSTAHVCRLLNMPVILVVDARAMARSIAALVHGFTSFDAELRVVGVIANRVGSESHAAILRDSLESAGLPPLLGALPKADNWAMDERHLGLVTAAESGDRQAWFHALAEGIEKHVDLDRLLAQSTANHPMTNDAPQAQMTNDQFPRMGIACDEAFQFYYEDNLDRLRQHGVDIVPFSPLHDSALPPGLAGLYIGGGYPELHGERLSANHAMRNAVRAFADNGNPIYAECGGLMYLCEVLRDQRGREWAMCGVLPACTRMESRLRRLGYVEAETLHDGMFGPRGTRIRGHEFHWSHLLSMEDDVAPAFSTRSARDSACSQTGLKRGNVWASYVHVHLASNPEAARMWAATLRTVNEVSA